ncbi:MAG: glycosyltransferase family 4 protein [Bacteroidales bacterium]|nr:glycosyltransferase family 4 protein [Bacteroidales bacterium]
MNILSITGILPIPGVAKSNDFLIPLYTAYKKKYPSDKVFIFRLEKYIPLSKKNRKYAAVRDFELSGITVKLLRYLSTWRYPGLHAVISSYTSYYFNIRKIGKFIKEHKIDILHAEYIIPDGYLAYLISRKFKIPFVVTTHYEFRYFNVQFSRRIALKALQHAGYVTPLNYTAKYLFEKHQVGNICIVPHGIDEFFLQTKQNKLNTETVSILSIGALIPLKNFDKVIYALSDLKNKYSFVYTIVGDGPELPHLKYLVEKFGLKNRVSFIGKIPYSEIPNEISRHDIFVMPSYFESFGRALTEAMAVGLPVICAKNTGIHGYFTEGQEGFSVDHQNIRDIEEKLAMLLEDATLRSTMGRNAKKLMAQYTWDKVAEKFHDLYRDLL